MSSSPAHYDAVIIGAGMSGLAAAVRLGMFGRKVLVLERHNSPGGLNSFYARGKRKYDVGLHALTNWVPEGTKGAPLVKLMRQLRIRREELDLCPQLGSRVTMAGKNLRLNNDYESLLADVARANGAQDGVGDRVHQHVAIGMRHRSAIMFETHSTQYKRTTSAMRRAWFQPVQVISMADAIVGGHRLGVR